MKQAEVRQDDIRCYEVMWDDVRQYDPRSGDVKWYEARWCEMRWPVSRMKRITHCSYQRIESVDLHCHWSSVHWCSTSASSNHCQFFRHLAWKKKNPVLGRSLAIIEPYCAATAGNWPTIEVHTAAGPCWLTWAFQWGTPTLQLYKA